MAAGRAVEKARYEVKGVAVFAESMAKRVRVESVETEAQIIEKRSLSAEDIEAVLPSQAVVKKRTANLLVGTVDGAEDKVVAELAEGTAKRLRVEAAEAEALIIERRSLSAEDIEVVLPSHAVVSDETADLAISMVERAGRAALQDSLTMKKGEGLRGVGKKVIREDLNANYGELGGGTGLEPWVSQGRSVRRVLDLELRVGSPKQWVQWIAEESSLRQPQVDSKTVADWAVEVFQGKVCLRWKLKGVMGCAMVDVVPWEQGIEGLKWPGSWQYEWRQPVVPRPEVFGDGSLGWEAELEPMPALDEEEVQRWWGVQAEEALRECREEVGNEGGFFESNECAPDLNVLGSWVLDALRESVQGLQSVECAETTHASNPDWARERHALQVFQAGRLHDFVDEWREAGADDEVLGWLTNGYHIQVGAPSEESGLDVEGWHGINKRNGGVARENPEDLRVIVMDVLVKKAWEVVLEDEVCNKMPLNLAPKPGKEPPWRLILNCMTLNEFVALWGVRYETLRTVPLVVVKGDWLFSIDFTDAYYQILLDLASQRLVGAEVDLTQQQVQELKDAGMLPEGFVWDRTAEFVNVRVRPRGLPMGFRNSCAVWTKIARVLTTLWRRKGFKLVHLIDDLLFSVSGTYEEACKVRDEVLADLDRLGVLVNWKKSVLKPNKCVRFLGMLVNSEVFRFFVPPDKIAKLKDLVLDMAGKSDTTVRCIASIVGKIMSMQLAVPAVRIVSAGLYDLVRPKGDWDRSQVVTEDLVEELCGAVKWVQQWARFGNPIRRYVGMTGIRIFVDAGTGYGWRIDGVSRGAEFEGEVLARSKEWELEQADMWQPWKELWALRYCLEEEGERLEGASVLVQPDATTTVAYVNKGSGPSKELTRVMRGIWDVCMRFCITLKAEHFEGDRMINTGVDSLSRMAEFSVAQSLFRQFNKGIGFGVRGYCRGYSIDLWASAKTAKCKRYAAKNGPVGSVGDARVLQLERGENYWVVPPLGCVSQVVMQLLESGVLATVVVPDWPDQPWHVQLRSACSEYQFLRWHESKPVMWDVCVKSNHHVHLVDKWDFVAFALGGEEARQPVEMWRARREKAVVGNSRIRNSMGLWSHKALLRSRVNRGGQRSTQGVLRRSGKRVLRVLSLCNGCGTASLALEQLRITADIEVVFVELDEDCRAFTQWRFPSECGGWSSDVKDWASSEFKVKKGDERHWFDLIVAGFPCQDLSLANRNGAGLEGVKSGLFFDIWSVVEKLRVVNPRLHTVLECVSFEKKFPLQFELVSTTVGVSPVMLCASRIAPCYRRRAFWNSFVVGPLQFDPGATPASVLEAGRWTDQPKMPTLVASGTNSWSTRAVVFDERRGGQVAVKQPLRTVEMERCQGMHMPDHFTAMPGFNEKTRHHMIGNSFHVGVIKHIFRAWIVLLKEFDSTLGYPGEGPTWEQRQLEGAAAKNGSSGSAISGRRCGEGTVC